MICLIVSVNEKKKSTCKMRALSINIYTSYAGIIQQVLRVKGLPYSQLLMRSSPDFLFNRVQYSIKNSKKQVYFSVNSFQFYLFMLTFQKESPASSAQSAKRREFKNASAFLNINIHMNCSEPSRFIPKNER